MFASPIVITVWRSAVDAFGDPVDTDTHTIAGCAVLGHDTSEDTERREQVVETATLAVPAGADVDATDEVSLPDGTRWHVTGRVRTRRSPFSDWQPGAVAPIRRVTG